MHNTKRTMHKTERIMHKTDAIVSLWEDKSATILSFKCWVFKLSVRFQVLGRSLKSL